MTVTANPHQLITEKMGQGAALISPDGVVLFANPRFAAMLGQDPATCPGTEIAGVVVVDDRPALAELMGLLPGQSKRAHIDLDTPDGPVPTMFEATRPHIEGNPVLCLVTDLRAHKQVEAALRTSEQLSAQVLDALPVGVYIANSNGSSLYANAEALRVSGLPALPATMAEAINALNLVEVGTGSPYPAERIPVVRALAGESSHVIDIEIRDEPDQVVPLELWGTPVFGDDDTVTSVIATVADVTERVRAERVIAGQAAMLDLAHDAVIVWNPTGRITYWNRGATAMYGYSSEQAVGSNIHDLLQTQWPRPLDEILSSIHLEGRWDSELEQRRADGTRVVVESRWAPHLDLDGSLLGIMEFNRDITNRVDAEAALAKRAAELEAANSDIIRSNEDLEQFAYVASHDLSEPLRAIGLPISLLARRYQGKLDEEADEYIAFAVDGCVRMQEMIDDLLRWSRVGRIEELTGPVDCADVVNRVLADLAQTITDARATVTVGALPTVYAERNQLTQVFQNLISNAVKFVHPDRPPTVDVAAELQGRDWRFTVTDNGIGIEPRHQNRVFGMFKRLHTRDEFPGTGIGLAIAKKVIERHGGVIGVEDAPSGSGTRFWFTLRASPPA